MLSEDSVQTEMARGMCGRDTFCLALVLDERTSAHVQAGGKERAEGLTVSHERTEGRQARLGPHGCWRASLQRGRGPLEKSGPRGPTGLWLQGGLTRFSPGTVGASAAGAAQAASEAAPRHT